MLNNLPIVLKDDDGIRPAGKPDKCFYCKQAIGTSHKYDCVILKKKVKIKYSFNIEIEVPYFWENDQIEFYRNYKEFNKFLSDNKNTLQNICRAEVIEVLKDKPYRYNNKKEIINVK